jgi:hypothetical protein
LIHRTERLVVEHVKWRISIIADEIDVEALTNESFEDAEEALDRYEKYIPPAWLVDPPEPEEEEEQSTGGQRSPA